MEEKSLVKNIGEEELMILNSATGGFARPQIPLIKVYQRNPQNPDLKEMDYGSFYISKQKEDKWEKIKINQPLKGQILLKTEHLSNQDCYTNEVINRNNETFKLISKEDKVVIREGKYEEIKTEDLKYIINLYVYFTDDKIRKMQIKPMSLEGLFNYFKTFDYKAPATMFNTIFTTAPSKRINPKTKQVFPQYEINFGRGDLIDPKLAYKRVKELMEIRKMMAGEKIVSVKEKEEGWIKEVNQEIEARDEEIKIEDIF